MRKLCLSSLFVFVLTACAWAQSPADPVNPCPNGTQSEGGSGPCDPYLTLGPGEFQATPFVDTLCPSNHCPRYGDQDNNIVSLYGDFGNNEATSSNSGAVAHYSKGVHLGTPPNIQPLCKDGNPPPCLAGQGPAEIVFLFIGFSNCDIEICGGNSDAWDGQDHNPALFQHHLAGQPCATYCPNLNNPNMQRFPVAWNQVKGGDRDVGGDGVTQQSFLYQIYGGQTRLVGPDVVAFNGALGAQTLDKWDPTPYGYYAQH